MVPSFRIFGFEIENLFNHLPHRLHWFAPGDATGVAFVSMVVGKPKFLKIVTGNPAELTFVTFPWCSPEKEFLGFFLKDFKGRWKMVQKQRAPWYHCSACDYSRRDQFWNCTGIKKIAKKTQVRISAENAATKDKQRRLNPFWTRIRSGCYLPNENNIQVFFKSRNPPQDAAIILKDEASGKHIFWSHWNLMFRNSP